MIRVIHTTFGPVHYAVCSECKTEGECISGVQHSDQACNVAIPRGWTSEVIKARPIDRPMMRHYCPRCSVAPQYRK